MECVNLYCSFIVLGSIIDVRGKQTYCTINTCPIVWFELLSVHLLLYFYTNGNNEALDSFKKKIKIPHQTREMSDFFIDSSRN